MIKIFFILAYFFVAFFLFHCKQTTQIYSAVGGKLDLSNHNFKNAPTLKLQGEWEFYWNKLLLGEDFKKENPTFVSVPKTWEKLSPSFPLFGYATYKLKVTLPKDMKEVWIRASNIYISHKIFINEKEVSHSGSPSSSKEETISSLRPSIGSKELSHNEIEIVVHVSNFEFARAGIQNAILLGTKEGILKTQNTQFFSDVFLIGGLSLLFMYLLSIYFLRKSELHILVFAFGCLALAIRTLCVGERLITLLIPNLSLNVQYKILYISYYVVIPTLFHFVNHFFHNKITKLIIRWNYIFCFIIIIIQPFLEFYYASKLLSFMEIYVFLCFVFVFLNYLKNYNAIKNYAKPFLFGISIFFLAVVHDILVNNQVFQNIYLVAYGIWIFIFALSHSLNKKLLDDFRKVENLTNSLQKMNKHIKKFVPFEFIKLLNKEDLFQIDLGVQTTKDLTILFSDIRSFTSLAEKMQSDDCFEFLNTYFGRIGPIIRKHGGFIDKYLGDGIMALFPNKVEDAISAAIEMQKEVTKLNQERNMSIQIGIGIHKGKTILGIIGENQRTEGTVISDAVNLASRVEALTKDFNSQILVTLETFFEIENYLQFQFRFLDTVKVKGKSNEIAVGEILDAYPKEKLELIISTKFLFEEAVGLYKEGKILQAKEKFYEVLNTNPADSACHYYMSKINDTLTSSYL